MGSDMCDQSFRHLISAYQRCECVSFLHPICCFLCSGFNAQPVAFGAPVVSMIAIVPKPSSETLKSTPVRIVPPLVRSASASRRSCDNRTELWWNGQTTRLNFTAQKRKFSLAGTRFVESYLPASGNIFAGLTPRRSNAFR